MGETTTAEIGGRRGHCPWCDNREGSLDWCMMHREVRGEVSVPAPLCWELRQRLAKGFTQAGTTTAAMALERFRLDVRHNRAGITASLHHRAPDPDHGL